MVLKGVHFLLTYRCDLECDHCFVWGSPKAKSTFTLKQVRNILAESKKLGTVDSVAIEGGEPFLYYPILTKTVEEASNLGFRVEILSNCYWAASSEDAVEWLLPFAKAENIKLSLSSDLYHAEGWETEQAKNAVKAASKLGIKVGVIAVKHADGRFPSITNIEGAKVDPWEIMYRGRAASTLSEKAVKKSWHEFTKCPYEDFTNQERVHIDPLGHVHVCQGISIGNAWQTLFSKIIESYNPYENMIIEPLVRNGPKGLVEKFNLPHSEVYADACHLCYEMRTRLRGRFPEILTPDQMYGEFEQS